MTTNTKQKINNDFSMSVAATTAMPAQFSQQILDVLVPVRSLTHDHLNTLMRDQQIEYVCSGQTLVNEGDYDNDYVYLLSGNVALISSDGSRRVVCGGDAECRFPLAHTQPRKVSVEALSDCTLIRFDSDKLDAMLAWDQASRYIMLDVASQRDLDEDAEWMLTLLRSNFFYKVPPINIREIINKFTSSYHSTGETILRQGEIGDRCYFIKEGLVGVYQANEESCPPELVADLSVGRCFGEDALIDEVARNATIITHTNSVLMQLDKRDFFLLLKKPEVNTYILSQARGAIPDSTCWIDVRTQDEYESGHYHNAVNMPLEILKLKSRLLDKSVNYMVYCNSGRRSEAAAHFLSQDGFNVHSLVNGFDADGDQANLFAYRSSADSYFSQA